MWRLATTIGTNFGERLTEEVLKAAGLEGRTQVDMCVNERG